MRPRAGVLGAAVFIAVVLLALRTMSENLSSAEAAELIRQHAENAAAAELQATIPAGERVPPRAAAERWKQERARIRGVRFESVAVKRTLFSVPLQRRASFVVRVVERQGDALLEPVYYRIGEYRHPNFVERVPAILWYVPL
ncbi:MAG: hypothetical protein R3A78_13260 [Polyangiales bacterium]